MKLLTYPDSKLKKPSKQIISFDRDLHREIQEVHYALDLYKVKSLAAVQLGIFKTFFVYIDPKGAKNTLLNPHIVDISNADLVPSLIETCASFPDVRFSHVLRPRAITISGIDFQSMKLVTMTATGSLAKMFCHEVDHFSGRLPTDYMTDERLDEFKKLWKTKNSSLS